mgnify:CR=1 FL=1
MSEVFPNGIPDDLEEQLEAAMNNNSAVNVDQNSEVGGYSTRAVNAVLTGDKLEKLKGIRFEKNDTTIKILEILKELMGRSFSGKGRVDRLEYNADVTSDYIMTLFKTPASYDFDEEIIDVYSEGTELITGVELLMWYLHEFFDDNEGVITHVGIIMKDNYIIHAYGKVRIDRLDHSGIYNIDKNTHTHKLRVIKKIMYWINSTKRS